MSGKKAVSRHGQKYERGVVNCPKCLKPIYVYKSKAVADEFSAQCKSCGSRSVFSKMSLKNESLPERRKKPR